MTQWPRPRDLQPEAPSNDGAPTPTSGSEIANTTMRNLFPGRSGASCTGVPPDFPDVRPGGTFSDDSCRRWMRSGRIPPAPADSFSARSRVEDCSRPCHRSLAEEPMIDNRSANSSDAGGAKSDRAIFYSPSRPDSIQEEMIMAVSFAKNIRPGSTQRPTLDIKHMGFFCNLGSLTTDCQSQCARDILSRSTARAAPRCRPNRPAAPWPAPHVALFHDR